MSSTVLVVDDSATMRQIVATTLQGAGWPVVSARNGRDALEAARREPIALVITDWNMPEMNGLELIRALRALDGYDDVPILVLTTETDELDKNAAREAGATGWLGKPVDAGTLTEVASALLG